MRDSTPLSWLTSLSLDAPLVAVTWQNALALESHVTLNWTHRALVFVSVWLGYSADRWFDSWRHKKNVSHRHQLYERFRYSFLSLWITAFFVSVSFASIVLTRSEFLKGMALALASVIVTLIVQFARLRSLKSTAKSILTALLITASVLLFGAPRFPSSIPLPETLILFSLFALNCSFIHFWDRPIDSLQENEPETPIRIVSLLCFFAINVLLIARYWSVYPLAQFSGFSTLALSLVHCFRGRIDANTRRTLADVSLLTPIILFF